MRPVHERETETQRDAARQTETQRDAARRSETQRDTERHSETQRDTERHCDRHTETHRETGWVEMCVYTVNDVMEWVAPTTHSAC